MSSDESPSTSSETIKYNFLINHILEGDKEGTRFAARNLNYKVDAFPFLFFMIDYAFIVSSRESYQNSIHFLDELLTISYSRYERCPDEKFSLTLPRYRVFSTGAFDRDKRTGYIVKKWNFYSDPFYIEIGKVYTYLSRYQPSSVFYTDRNSEPLGFEGHFLSIKTKDVDVDT